MGDEGRTPPARGVPRQFALRQPRRQPLPSQLPLLEVEAVDDL